MGITDLDRQHLIHLDLSCFETVSQDYVFLKYELLIRYIMYRTFTKNTGFSGIYSVEFPLISDGLK